MNPELTQLTTEFTDEFYAWLRGLNPELLTAMFGQPLAEGYEAANIAAVIEVDHNPAGQSKILIEIKGAD